MTYEPLHHKYRPQTFAQLVGQTAIATTLTNALRQQRIAPAYLFTGPRGTGKTSSARILAKSLNCIQEDRPTEHPCGVCEVCLSIIRGAALDVIEIDAASNTGVDNIRELIERAQFAPVQCRYKVYVIDECHMLSVAAFNALLKTLEEPPPRVVFVLATTDPQRVLPTIISRCQRFDFRRIPLEAMVGHLGAIAHQEQIQITPDALELVGQIAQGGLRDAESLLDQLSLLPGPVRVEQVWDLVGAVPERDLLTLVQAIAQDQPEQILDQARHLMDRGREPLIVLQNLASFYRDLLIAKTAPTRQDLVAITAPTWLQLCEFVQGFDLATILVGQQHLRTAELQIKNTTQPRLWLEVTLMGLLPSAQILSLKSQAPPPASASLATPPLTPPAAITSSSPPQPPKTSLAPIPQQSLTEAAPKPSDFADPQLDATTELTQIWNTVIEEVQPYSTQVLVRQQCRLLAFRSQDARVAVSSQPLLKITQGKLPNLEAAFEKVFQRKVKVTLEVASSPEQPLTPAPLPIDNGQYQNRAPVNEMPLPPLVAPPPPTLASHSLPMAAAAPPPKIGEAATPPSTPEPQDSEVPPTPTAGLSQSFTWQPEDEVTRAAKSLADFFRGQIVSLESGSTAPEAIASDPLPIWEEPDGDGETSF
ncbi:hypothetical protein DO97_17235 [Neosynechococcus sphagnicola sy1]|uniref:DNA polymerase III subunit gamma/tau n=1 Tax=Neosynechococcus sphagnicola sy1 TaxID=1497020 RepID=A0A098THN8_9CYAN|nr:DNA polymerase III subunit gamma/tau [Neosynechococcus sphagnicola]KGF71594.1 hypothetical protein DO97_17235 [Neosynechococcus sphagnicola sy1]